MFKTIVLGLDGSESSDHALQYATTLAKEQGSSVRVVHVIEHRQRLTHAFPRTTVAGENALVGERDRNRLLVLFVASVVHDDIALKTAKHRVAEVFDLINHLAQVIACHAKKLYGQFRAIRV